MRLEFRFLALCRQNFLSAQERSYYSRCARRLQANKRKKIPHTADMKKFLPLIALMMTFCCALPLSACKEGNNMPQSAPEERTLPNTPECPDGCPETTESPNGETEPSDECPNGECPETPDAPNDGPDKGTPRRLPHLRPPKNRPPKRFPVGPEPIPAPRPAL